VSHDEAARVVGLLCKCYPGKYGDDEVEAVVRAVSDLSAADVEAAVERHFSGDRGRFKPAVVDLRRELRAMGKLRSDGNPAGTGPDGGRDDGPPRDPLLAVWRGQVLAARPDLARLPGGLADAEVAVRVCNAWYRRHRREAAAWSRRDDGSVAPHWRAWLEDKGRRHVAECAATLSARCGLSEQDAAAISAWVTSETLEALQPAIEWVRDHAAGAAAAA